MDKSTKTGGGCGDEYCNSGRRNRYFPRKQFTADTYQVEQNFHQQRRHLLNRAIHGWGVVYGFALKMSAEHLEIGAGLALDACGRELVWIGTQCAESQRIDLDDVLALDPAGKLVDAGDAHCRRPGDPSPWNGGTFEDCWLLRVHYAERLIAPVAIKDPCQCDNQEWDQVCETVRFSLQRIDCSKCCTPATCELHCTCSHSYCCPEASQKPAERGGCRCLCEHLTGLDPTPDCCTLTRAGKGWKIDLLHGVPLACVRLAPDKCRGWTIGAIHDDCGPRRLVKRNDLLFDLIRGCDLTHITRVSWEEMHRKTVEFKTFKDFFGAPDEKGAFLTRFSVSFSNSVQIATITPDCFSMVVYARDKREGWGQTLRVPIVDVHHDDIVDTHYARGATLLVDADWVRGALDDVSEFEKFVSRVEIAVRGDYLLDCNGLAVDANARGLSAAPTGNGTPGDTFISTFLVRPMKPSDYATPSVYEGM
jgi:hypothetical protein